jgi:hypothetical protein
MLDGNANIHLKFLTDGWRDLLPETKQLNNL